MKVKNVPEYDVVRVIATLAVIIGHCTYYSLGAPNGGCDYTLLTQPGLSMFYNIVRKLTDIIYLFHMPLYMALSGALLRHKEILGGGTNHFLSLLRINRKSF